MNVGSRWDHLSMNFRTADGAEYRGKSAAGHEQFSVSIPFDGEGYFGRDCPECNQHFRMNGEDYDKLPDDLRLTCPYCGHIDDHSEFMTTQQRDRMMQVVRDAGMQMVTEMLDKAFGSMARSTRNNRFVSVSYRSKPFYPEPLPGIDEERLVRERTCSECGVRYALFGEHRFCPVSGALDDSTVAREALEAERAKLDALGALPADQLAILREQGVIDRISVDTLGRVVGIVESVASAHFRKSVAEAEDYLKGKGNLFQRLDDLADIYGAHLGIDPRADTELAWASLQRLWAARHAHTHAGGLVDAKYLKAMPGSKLKLGQRVIVPEEDARLAIRLASRLVDILTSSQAPPFEVTDGAHD